MRVILFSFVIIFSVWSVEADHLVVGNVSNRVKLGNHSLVEYNAIPFMKRVKFYYAQVDPNIIQGIQALDNMHSKASITVTAGGVGYSYVNLRLKSERGYGLSYDIGLYVNEDY